MSRTADAAKVPDRPAAGTQNERTDRNPEFSGLAYRPVSGASSSTNSPEA